MADNTIINQPTTIGDTIATLEDASGVKHEQVVIEFLDPSGEPVQTSAANPLPVLASIDTTGLATEGKQDDEIALLTTISSQQQTDALTDTELRATPVPVSGTFFQATQPVSATNLDIRDLVFASDKVDASGSAVTAVVSATDLDIRNLVFATDKVDASGTVLGAGTNNIGDVDILSFPSATAATLSNVNDTNTSTTLLASNAARKMAVIYNDSTVALYIKFGATASATSFTVKVLAQGYYELPIPVYTGLIDGVWDSNQSGAARVTEW